MPALTTGSTARGAITIGVIGARELVQRIMSIAKQTDRDWRLVGADYTEEQEARARLRTIEAQIDVCLFAGPLAYDLARQEGDMTVPATYVPLSGSALYAALLRGMVNRTCDPARVSVDSVSPDELSEAYAEIGVETEHVHVYPYDRPESAAKFAGFHERLYRRGETTVALTTIPVVEQKLAANRVPVLRMVPSTATLRRTLDTAALLGSGSRSEEAQIAVAIVQPAASARPVAAGPGSYWQQELQLSLHRALLTEARHSGAIIWPRDGCAFVMVTTVGALDRLTDGFRVAPFVARIGRELGFSVEVGIGLGATAHDAETKAATTLATNAADGSAGAYLSGPGDVVVSLPLRSPRAEEDAATALSGRSKGTQILERMLAELPDGTDPEGAETPVVDADTVAASMDVTARTARRLLHTLVDEGLAWPLPPIRSTRAGRPRQHYQLITRRLSR